MVIIDHHAVFDAAALGGQFGQTAFQAIGKGIAHSDQFGVGVGHDGLTDSTGTTATAADETDFQDFVFAIARSGSLAGCHMKRGGSRNSS